MEQGPEWVHLTRKKEEANMIRILLHANCSTFHDFLDGYVPVSSSVGSGVVGCGVGAGVGSSEE